MGLINIPTSMWWLLGGVLLFLVLVFIVTTLFFPEPEKREYEYLKKRFLMTDHETGCFHSLERTVGEKFYIFPQINFSTLLDHKIRGQNWRGAHRHIDEKSVDFVLCAKNDLSVVLAIELDDSTHERPDRWRRDREQERIFHQAGLPLLRLPYSYIEDSLAVQIEKAISSPQQVRTKYKVPTMSQTAS